jgi:hypothetical protein
VARCFTHQQEHPPENPAGDAEKKMAAVNHTAAIFRSDTLTRA